MKAGNIREIEIDVERLPGGTVIEMMPVPGGRFEMGSGETIHQVQIPDFYLGKYPVTNGQYMQFVKATKSHYPEWMQEGNEYNVYTGKDDHYKKLGAALTNEHHPIVGVSWEGAVAFCQWLSEVSGKTYRLPSEAEWEYAARGGNQSLGFLYSGSNKLKEVGWYRLNSHGATKPVGLKLANELGIYDLSGNVWEWCADHWHENYQGAPEDGSAWVKGGDQTGRVVRGGSWIDYVDYCRVSFRDGYNSGNRIINVGFRLARY